MGTLCEVNDEPCMDIAGTTYVGYKMGAWQIYGVIKKRQTMVDIIRDEEEGKYDFGK